MKFGRSSGVTSPKGKPVAPNVTSIITSPRNGGSEGSGPVSGKEVELEPDLLMMKLMSIIDAEIAALDAPKHEMPRPALKAMTQKAASSIGRYGQALYGAEDDARAVYLASHEEARITESAVRADIEHLEAALIAAKVAVMETQAETSRAEMQLANSLKALSQPGIKADLRAAEAEIRLKTAEQKNEATSLIRLSLEKRVRERGEEVEKEKAQNSKLEKAIKDFEGDWGL